MASANAHVVLERPASPGDTLRTIRTLPLVWRIEGADFAGARFRKTNMDYTRALNELYEERHRLGEVIRSIESLTQRKQPPALSRRGRKSMSASERYGGVLKKVGAVPQSNDTQHRGRPLSRSTQRVLFLYQQFSSLTPREIAERTGLTPQHVRVILRRHASNRVGMERTA